VIDGEQIPMIDDGMTTTVTADGFLDVNYVADAYFPSEWLGEDYTWVLDDPDGYRRGRIVMADTDGEYVPIIDGVVTSVGSGGPANLPLRCRIKGPEFFLDSIPLSTSFSSTDLTVDEILDTFLTRLTEARPMLDGVSVSISEGGDVAGDLSVFDVVRDGYRVKKRFHGNRDTLRDGFQWLAEITGGVVFFEPTDDGVQLTFTQNPVSRRTISARGEDPPAVRENDALYEINPLNAVKAVGTTGQKINLGPLETVVGANTLGEGYPVAIATADPLVEAAGGVSTGPKVEVSEVDPSVTANRAISALLDRLHSAAGGDIVLDAVPRVTPRDVLTVPTACADVIDAAPRPLPYRVQSVTHETYVHETDRNRAIRSHSTVECSVALTRSDVSVESTVVTDPSEEPTLDERNVDATPPV
jgi:hypothetical protein